MKIVNLTLAITFLVSSAALAAPICKLAHTSNLSESQRVYLKTEMKKEGKFVDRYRGPVQITGKQLVEGDEVFPNRTPADPVIFEDKKTGEVLVYGTLVDGAKLSYLSFPNKQALLKGSDFKLIKKDVYLPNGQLLEGKEAIWDTYRLSYETLSKVFPKSVLEKSYEEAGIDAGSDMHYGGIALQKDGSLGAWTTHNWRRRVHSLVQVDGKMQILKDPVFNKIDEKASEDDYAGFGLIKTKEGKYALPGDYIGHAYGPNFVLRKVGTKLELWIISEEVTRRVQEKSGLAEVTEIVARKMVNPFETSSAPEDRVVILTVNGQDGLPHPDSDRGAGMGNTKLIEGFRPLTMSPDGFKITKRQILQADGTYTYVEDEALKASDQRYYAITGSSANFAGDDYDARVAIKSGTDPIGQYKMILDTDRKAWKGFLKEVKRDYRLSWAGRGTFMNYNGNYWLVFHAADKDIRPNGSYSGPIPPDTEKYHRNLYHNAVEFFINIHGEPDMRLIPRSK